jgi:hypothetical protein
MVDWAIKYFSMLFLFSLAKLNNYNYSIPFHTDIEKCFNLSCSIKNNIGNKMIDHIKIVTTCINYSDYLEHTLPHNKKIYEDITVFTNPVDIATKSVCKQNDIKYQEIDGLGLENDCFDTVTKTRVYDIFLKEHINQWILFIDSDILLPKNLKYKLTTLEDKPNYLYCTSRVYLPMDYTKINENILKAQEADDYTALGWTHLSVECWGYFLLFFNNNLLKPWQINDIDFCNKNWRQHDRISLGNDFAVAHIPHGTWDDWGKNFYGRKTPLFTEYINKH